MGVGSTVYAYNASSWPTSIENALGETTSWTYDSAGQITRQDFENGLYTEFGYDDRGRVTSNVVKNALGVAQRSESVSYNAAGRPTSRTIDGVTTTYNYDAAGNLLSESRTGYSASYTYDTSGRRTSKTLGGNTESYTYSGGRLSQAGSTTFGYDANSRRTSMVTGSNTTSYGYDYEDRLTSVTPPGASAITYVYNGLGSRVGRGSETYRRAGASAGSPLLADGSASYTPGISERRGGQSSFFHWGSFGDLSAQSNGSGALTDLYSYDWFQVIVGHTGSSTTPIGAGGGYVDSGTGGVGHGGGGDYEPWLGGGPSVAPMIQPEFGNVNYGLDYGPPLNIHLVVSDFCAGWGDGLTWGGTGVVRNWLGVNGIVNTDSPAYGAGDGVSFIHGFFLPGPKFAGKAKFLDDLPALSEIPQVLQNAASGRAAEIKALDELINLGYNATLFKKGISTPYGMRFPDIVIANEFGDWIMFVEVKSGKARYSDAQWIKDEYILELMKVPTMLWRM